MSFFKGVRAAKVSKTGTWLSEGFHRVKLLAVKTINSSANSRESFFIIEMMLLSTDNPDLKIGAEYSQVINMSNVMAFPNIKIFVGAVSGVDPNDENLNELVEAHWTKELGVNVDFEQICDLFVSDDQPLKDLEMDLECRLIKTGQNKDGEFTKHLWQPREVA